jgi:aromatic-L-amino-acid/L-tryptophan decarboxylase
MLTGVKIRKLPTSKENKFGNFTLKGEVLEAAIKVEKNIFENKNIVQEDRANGLIPFILVVTVGTTNTCGIESIQELGQICQRENIWVHVDAAYAGGIENLIRKINLFIFCLRKFFALRGIWLFV